MPTSRRSASRPRSGPVTGLKEYFAGVARGEVEPPPVARLIGIESVEIEGEEAVMSLEVRDMHRNPMGTVHGGIFCTLADAAMFSAYSVGLDPDESLTTVELKMNYLRPVERGRLRAEARVVHRGGRIGLTECDLRDESGQVVARASSTVLKLGRDA